MSTLPRFDQIELGAPVVGATPDLGDAEPWVTPEQIEVPTVHGEDVYAEEGTPFPDRTLDSIKRTKVGIKGPTTTPVAPSNSGCASRTPAKRASTSATISPARSCRPKARPTARVCSCQGTP